MWSIGIYKGSSLDNLFSETNNPIITKDIVTDFEAEFVADPFMINVKGMWYLFFEALDKPFNKGRICVACSKDLVDWNYLGVALKEDFHLSYPFVFDFNGKIYMTPETLGADGVILYEAVDFPLNWRKVKKIINGKHADPTVFYYQNLWWMFTCETPYQYDSLSVFWSEKLDGDWYAHKENPVYSGIKSHSRPGGRIYLSDGGIFRFFQNCYNVYGEYVGISKIEHLSTDIFRETIISEKFLGPSGKGWNKERMHHIDCHELSKGCLVACVDGYARR